MFRTSGGSKMQCLICNSNTNLLFKTKLLGKYEVDYYKCPICDFIQTEKPYWLKESYCSAITDLDVGLVDRSIFDADVVATLIKNNFKIGAKFLDFAGGYGLFVRLMRDRGFNFYRADKYCENIFAQNFDIKDIKSNGKFEVVTAFEVFEHLDNPIRDIKKMLSYSDTLVFTTELQPKKDIKDAKDWWYFTPETGQHIAFYAEKTLKYIAKKFDVNFYYSGQFFMFSKKKFSKNPFKVEKSNEQNEINSLIEQDFELAKKILSKSALPKESAEKDREKTLLEKLNLALSRLEIAETHLEEKNTRLVSLQNDIVLKMEESKKLNTDYINANQRLEAISMELSAIKSSLGWRILKLIDRRVIPVGSFRRKMVGFVLRIMKSVYRLFKKLINNIYKFEIIFWKFKPKKNRVVNVNSKKLVYIGHSYHVKTQSTAFLINYLKKFYDVKVIEDESWRGTGIPYPDLSFIDESYLGVVFFQNLPSREIVNKINNKNIVFFPMYDGSGNLGYDFWRNWRDLKIMNFSRTLHEKLSHWGFESMFVQYFPEPMAFTKGNTKEAFFWQRLSFINVDTVSNLFGKTTIKLHIHKAIDPGHSFLQPSKEVEEKYQITYSEWFKTREEMQEVIRAKAIYIAPRLYEGIGLSFLEAMAMGKAVIAVDNPTMNEYITNNKTGYLFKLSNPKEIDFSNLAEVQKNTYEFMQNGYKNWAKDKKKIIEFIERH